MQSGPVSQLGPDRRIAPQLPQTPACGGVS